MADYTYLYWNEKDYYNFSVEFNRIENYISYCKKWLEYYNINVGDMTIKVNWSYSDIPDLNDYNRIKTNINILLQKMEINEELLNIDTNSYNQNFNDIKANEMEGKLTSILVLLGEWQSMFQMTGNSVCGNSTRIIAKVV